MRPSWDHYFLEMARHVAKRSTCLRVPLGVGAVLVADKRVIACGYAGSIRGAAHCSDVGCLKIGDDEGCKRTVHAEGNCLVQAAHHGVSIARTICYTWPFSPCWDCFKLLVNGGVTAFVFPQLYRISEPQTSFAKELGIGWHLVRMPEDEIARHLGEHPRGHAREFKVKRREDES